MLTQGSKTHGEARAAVSAHWCPGQGRHRARACQERDPASDTGNGSMSRCLSGPGLRFAFPEDSRPRKVRILGKTGVRHGNAGLAAALKG